MRHSESVGALFLPEIFAIIAFVILFLGYFYEASKEIYRQRKWSLVCPYGIGALMQLLNISVLLCVLNLRYSDNPNLWNAVPASTGRIVFSAAEIVLFVLLAAVYVVMRVLGRRATSRLDNDSVEEAVMNLPSGICFAYESGRVVLSNHIILSLVHEITGAPLSDANVAWNAVMSSSQRVEEDVFLFQSRLGRFWKFEKKTLEADGERFVQIDADDVTALMNARRELEVLNAKITAQNERTRELIETISQKKSEQEILDMQRRVHHEVGQCIILADRYLKAPPDSGRLASLLSMWEKTFLGTPKRKEMDMSQREQEIIKAAEIGDCKVMFRGDRPHGELMYRLYLSAVREAVTNAMRHANATEVYVDGHEDSNALSVIISDNGTFDGAEVKEGVGLTKLREKLERAGVRMEIITEDGFSLSLFFPLAEENR